MGNGPEKEEETIPEWKAEEHVCQGVSLEKPAEETLETEEGAEKAEEAPTEVPESATTEEAE